MDVSMLDENVLGAVRQSLGADDEDDESRDAEISKMDVEAVLNSFLNWEGIIGYTSTIISAIDNIREAADQD